MVPVVDERKQLHAALTFANSVKVDRKVSILYNGA